MRVFTSPLFASYSARFPSALACGTRIKKSSFNFNPRLILLLLKIEVKRMEPHERRYCFKASGNDEKRLTGNHGDGFNGHRVIAHQFFYHSLGYSFRSVRLDREN